MTMRSNLSAGLLCLLLAGMAPAAITYPGHYKPGWNLTSVPVHPNDPSPASVFADLAAVGNTIEGNVLAYMPGGGYSAYPDVLTAIVPGCGYWIWVEQAPDDLVVMTIGARSGRYVCIDLAGGWNLVGHPLERPQLLADCLVRDSGSALLFSDAVAAGWVQTSLYCYDGAYSSVRPDGAGDDDSLRPWWGYWLLAYRDGLTLMVPRERLFPLTVMAYNIGSASPPLVLERPQMEQIADEIVASQADVLGFCEVDINTERRDYIDMVAEIRTALEARGWPMDHYFYAPVHSFDEDEYQVNGLLSRYPIIATDEHVLLPDGANLYKVVRATVQFAPGAVANCNMLHYGIADRQWHWYQTWQARQFLNWQTGPGMIMGDFNFTPDSQDYTDYVTDYVIPYSGEQIAPALLDSSMEGAGEHLPTVGGGAGIPSPPRIYQIDFIFGTDDIIFYDAFIPISTVSDHWPIATRALIPRQ